MTNNDEKLCPFKKELQFGDTTWNCEGIITKSKTIESFTKCLGKRCMAFNTDSNTCKLIEKN